MIRNRSEYTYVSIPDSIVIDGGIMPQRDVNGDGSWKILRGEDPAFIIESVAWKDHVVKHTNIPVYNMTNTLSGQPFRDAVFEIEGLVRRMPAETADTPDMVESGNEYSWRLCPNLWPFIGTHFSSRQDFAAGKPLTADSCRKIFYDLSRMKNYYESVSEIKRTLSNSEWSYKTIQYEGVAPIGGGWYVKTRANNDWFGKWYYLATGDIDIAEYNTNSWDLFKSIKACYLNCNARYTSNSGNWDRYYAVKVNPTISGSRIFLPSNIIVEVANKIQSSLGVNIPMSYPSQEWDYQTFTLDPLTMDFVYEFEDPTDFSEIGWNWTP